MRVVRLQPAGSAGQRRCAECGTFVRDSLRLLTQPDRVADALESLGKTYIGMYALAVGFAMPLVPTAIPQLVVLVALFRERGLPAVRRRGPALPRAGLQTHPTVGRRLNAYWLASLLEARRSQRSW